jgi:RsiW-degrading membrane proteinase PrsW (M82 family)
MSRLMMVSILLIGLACLAGPAVAQNAPGEATEIPSQITNSYTADQQLAERYVPVLYFHPDEVYRPQPVEVLNGITRLQQNIKLWFDPTILNDFTMQDLSTIYSDSTYFLDQWLGDTGSSEYANYSSHEMIYVSTLSPAAGGLSPLVYAHVVRDENPNFITIQYWFFYFYNDWFNKHEGDWEMIQVILSAEGQPEWAVYSQHNGGTRRSWASTPKEGDTHPVVYVARGSHANYFSGDEVYPNSQSIGNRMLVLVDRTGGVGRLVPAIRLIPTREELAADPQKWPGAGWLMFRGRWGETAVYGDFNGPTGPADKGSQWETPYTWGLAQPLDQRTWYLNRLEVEITSTDQTPAHVALIDAAGQNAAQSESVGDLAILHVEPPASILALVEGAPGAQENLTVNWPDRSQGMVTRMSFSGLVLDASGQARLELSSDQAIFQPAGDQLSPHLLEAYPAIWDAPDSVIGASTLTIPQILSGLLACLLISVVPVLILAGVLYWVDQYHREPIKLMALAFFWGAIPALLVTSLLQLFFKIPPDLLGFNTLEVVKLGVLAPVLEEILKAAGVLFVFWRFRSEIDDVLDGMIYGAMVGFGFAFISNLFRYTGDFIALGYPALNLNYLILRNVHVLNHGMYTAIFGACLGFAISRRSRRGFWALAVLGLLLAISTHALQNLLSNSLVGLNVFTVVVTASGTLLLWVIAGWSLVQQRRLLRTELHGLVHDSLYNSMLNPLSRLRAQWVTFRRHGFRTWVKLRRVQALCVRLANARLQERLHPERFTGSVKSEMLQSEIKQMFARLGGGTF